MIFFRQSRWWLAGCAAGPLLGFALFAQDVTPPLPSPSSSAPTNLVPPLPQPSSPVDTFRQLLAMSERDRNFYFAGKTSTFRDRLLAKVHEYQALDPDERELRLRATELRWYLMPLLRDSSANRTTQLALMPEGIRTLVQARLLEWDILPPPLQQEFLENEHALRYFAQVAVNNPPPSPPMPPGAGTDDQSRWNALSAEERQKMAAQFNSFFELTLDEKQRALKTLSEAERRQMENTLQSFEQMPVNQRAECIRSFTKFASMTVPEKTEFLKNAERWSAMSPTERQTWRDLVANVPQWPPLPTSAITPPLPPGLRPAMATNRN